MQDGSRINVLTSCSYSSYHYHSDVSNEDFSDFKRYRFVVTRILKEKDKIIFETIFQNDHPQSLHKSWHTYDKLYLNHRYPGATLHFYPARLSNFSHFSLHIDRRILTVVQKVVTWMSNILISAVVMF
jgi:hypothetical protein